MAKWWTPEGFEKLHADCNPCTGCRQVDEETHIQLRELMKDQPNEVLLQTHLLVVKLEDDKFYVYRNKLGMSDFVVTRKELGELYQAILKEIDKPKIKHLTLQENNEQN